MGQASHHGRGHEPGVEGDCHGRPLRHSGRGGGVLIVNLLGTPPTVDFTSGSAGQPVNITMQSVGTYGSGSHPTWVSYLVQSPQGQWVHTTVFQVPAHPAQHHHRQLRLRQPVPEPAARSGHRYGRERATLNGKPFRVINSNAGNGVGQPSPSLPSGSTCRSTAITEMPTSARGTLHHQLAAPGDQVLLREPGPGQLPLAMLRPLRLGLPLRQRGTDVDPGLHGRLHEGGCVSDADGSRPTSRRRTRRRSQDRPTTGGG